MKFYTAFLCSLILFTVFSCKMRNNHELTQGIYGQVTFSEGNMMPGPGIKTTKKNGVPRTILIYSAAPAESMVGQGPLYKAVNRPLIAKVKTDAAGVFRCTLKPGNYSIFTQEKDGLLFASLSNEKGEIGPVQIVPNQFLEYNIDINYKAVY